MAGFRKTGLLAANAFRIFLAFIFKNALAANNGRHEFQEFHELRVKAQMLNGLCEDRKPGLGNFIEKQRDFAASRPQFPLPTLQKTHCSMV